MEVNSLYILNVPCWAVADLRIYIWHCLPFESRSVAVAAAIRNNSSLHKGSKKTSLAQGDCDLSGYGYACSLFDVESLFITIVLLVHISYIEYIYFCRLEQGKYTKYRR